MTDAAKWKSVMIRAEDYPLLTDIAEFQHRSKASVLTDLIHDQWDRCFPKKPEVKSVYRRNPFLPPNPADAGLDK